MVNDRHVPTQRENLRQSIENPIQHERLGSTEGIQTEFLARDASKRDRWRLIRRTVFIAVVFCLIRSVPEYFLPLGIAIDVWGILAFVGVCIIVVTLIGWPRKTWHWAVYLVVLPLLLPATLIVRSMMVMLVMASLLTAIVSDRFATQSLLIGTSAPFERQRAKRIRKNWASRFYGLKTSRGIEFYFLGFLALVGMPWIYVSFIPDPPIGIIMLRVWAMIATIGVLLAVPVAIELIAALLYARKLLGFTQALTAFRRSLRDWFCYNLQDRSAPGLFQSPAGSTQARNWMFIGLISLWASTLNPLFSQQIGLREMLRYAAASKKAEEKKEASQPLPEKKPITFGSNPSSTPKPAVEEQKPEFQLQPYQQRTLERMPESQRAAYLATLKEQFEKSQELVSKPEPAQRRGNSITSAIGGFLMLIDLPQPDQFTTRAENMRWGAMFVLAGYYFVTRELVLIAFSFGLPLAFFYANTVRITASLRQQLESHPDSLLSFGNWEQLVSEMSTQGNDTEKESLLLGANASDNSPVMVPIKVFTEHAHILGDSGSGKTALGISILLNQIIRQPDCSVVVLDMKGDDTALFAGSQIDAAVAGKRFRWFTNELNRSTYAFNPFNQEYFSALSLYQKTDIITAALGLQYGTDYGRGFYSDANAEYLYRTLTEYPEIKSFAELARLLPRVDGISKEVKKNASHLISVTQRLAATEALNIEAGSKNHPPQVTSDALEFSDVFRTPQVVYMHLPSSLGTTSSAEIARIALYSLLGSARCTPEKSRKQVFVFVDEFQRIIANNLELIMQTARSMRIGLILANQSMLDLKRAGVDLTPAVRTNTRFKQVFACSNAQDLQEIVESSGELLEHQRSFQLNAGGVGFMAGAIARLTHAETVSPRLRINDLLLATDAPEQSIVQVRRGAGYAQFGGMPFIMRSTYHISQQEYEARKSSPWPDQVPGAIISRELPRHSALAEYPAVAPLTPRKNTKQRKAKAQPAPDKPPGQPSASGVEGLEKLFAEQERRRQQPKTPPKKPPE
ncbi:MAG: DUF87 domain-containing protein [Pirellulaceae bacterium]|nr:DUF87 domain-containing protein [Pirellulaceae bacterium]